MIGKNSNSSSIQSTSSTLTEINDPLIFLNNFQVNWKLRPNNDIFDEFLEDGLRIYYQSFQNESKEYLNQIDFVNYFISDSCDQLVSAVFKLIEIVFLSTIKFY